MIRARTVTLVAALLTLTLAGCPTTPGGGGGTPTSPITGVISLSTTQGDAPLTLVADATGSSSTAGTITSYTWDFGGLATRTGVSATYTFSNPGRYTITLTLQDDAGNVNTGTAEVRVAGTGAVTAMIAADPESGPAPLTVQFDGTGSSAPDDTITDYYWDFGDGDTSRQAQPIHVYTAGGTYTVTLRAVTAGGVEGTATAEINVTASFDGSLNFEGFQYATLPITPLVSPMTAVTFEAWIKPTAAGGTLVALGTPTNNIQVFPSTNSIVVNKGTDTIVAGVTGLANQWSHLAVAFDGAGEVRIYVDGVEVGLGTYTGTFTGDVLTLGQGFNGRIGRVAFWGTYRTAVEVAGDVNGPDGSRGSGLLGFWPLDEAGGQYLGNQVPPPYVGFLGLNDVTEGVDPTWTTDSPPAP